MVEYDVLIVGAGPAGLNCAKVLAGEHKKVLVLEKNTGIGQKVCAGGITRYNMDYLKLPGRIIGRSFNEIKMHTPYHSITIENESPLLYTVDRKLLAYWFLDDLDKSDVEVETGTRVTKIAKDHVVVNNGRKILYKNLVGADGSNSIVRKYLGVGSGAPSYGFHYVIPGTDHKDLEIFLDAELLKTWYAWIFPHSDFVSIGAGCNPRILSISKAKQNLDRLLDRRGIDRTDGEFQQHPIYHNYQGIRFGNVFLAGDAAGLASSLTGEGVYQAVISGEEIARMIIDNDHVPGRLYKMVNSLQFHDYCRIFMEQIGPFRLIGYEMIVLFIRRMVGLRPFMRFYP